MATLYLVSTPIGNLSDLSARAEEVLRAVEVVLAEDTRRSRPLLRRLGSEARVVSLHAHNERSRERVVLELLGEGRDLALVSDAGTPLVSDPGASLVDAVVAAGHRVVPVPGPSAVMAALAGAGFPADRFLFLGFPARSGKRRREDLERVRRSPDTVVLFESPRRLGALLEELARLCGPERRAVVARELTKIHEEFRRGTLGELAEAYRGEPPPGEVTVVVAPAGPEAAALEREEVNERARAWARKALADGVRPSAVARELRARLDVPRNDAYRIVQDLAGDAAPEPDAEERQDVDDR